MSNCAGPILNRCLHALRASMPAHCVLCGAGTPGERLCAACLDTLPLLTHRRCRICALPLAAGDVCGLCLEKPPQYDAVMALYAYAFPVDALVRAYKYGGDLTLARFFGRHLATHVRSHVDVVIPMPLAAARLRERGFNQAQELARHIGRALALPVLADACRKVADTAPQAELPWAERARNVRGAFVCDANLRGKCVAVIDDVMTTGATLNELAKNLKRAGAAEVRGWIVARTLR